MFNIFCFCLQYALSIYHYDLSFLKIILKSTFCWILQGKVHMLFSTVSTITHTLFLLYAYIMFFKLHLFMCLTSYTLSIFSQCKTIALNSTTSFYIYRLLFGRHTFSTLIMSDKVMNVLASVTLEKITETEVFSILIFSVASVNNLFQK